MIPTLTTYPLVHVLETMKLKHKPNTLWVELGVANGNSLNYISKFTTDKVYGFDTFEGMPGKWLECRDGFEKSAFCKIGKVPRENSNVELIQGQINTLLDFLKTHNKISFIHVDCEFYSSIKYILEVVKEYMDTECILVLDEFIEEVDNEKLNIFYKFVTENKIEYEWIGMHNYKNVAFIFKRV